LLAAWAAVLLMPLWLMIHSGRLTPVSGLAPALWHAHEMLFGMVAAVVVGFLFTAGKAWTGLQTPRGAQLGFFALLWLAARVAALLAPYKVFFFLDLLFLPLAAAVFAHLLVEAGNYRNLGVAAILGLLGLSNLAFHLGASGALDISPLSALHAGLALMVVLETVIAGRVIPMFTRNANPGLATAVPAWRERVLLLLTLVGLALWLADIAAAACAGVLLVAAALHAWRLVSWQPLSTRGRPILWVLHLAYAWIPIGLALLALALIGGSAVSPAVHALGVGAGAGLMLAMMTRTARGHTGRPIQASRAEAWAYRLVLLAAALRVAVPLLLPQWYGPGLVMAGALFAAAFLVYLGIYSSWLMAPRADGRED
jgi:uncharacterized protein involved in response to NO